MYSGSRWRSIHTSLIMDRIKKHKSHIGSKRAKNRPFGKFSKFLVKEEETWLKKREKEELDLKKLQEKMRERSW